MKASYGISIEDLQQLVMRLPALKSRVTKAWFQYDGSMCHSIKLIATYDSCEECPDEIGCAIEQLLTDHGYEVQVEMAPVFTSTFWD